MANNTHSVDFELSSSQYAKIVDGSQTGLDITTDFSFEAWIWLEQLSSTAGTSFEVMSKSGASPGYQFEINSTADKPRLLFYDGSANLSRFEIDQAIVVQTWTHVLFAVDISVPSAVGYIDTVSKTITDMNTAATTVNDSTDDFIIGARATGPDLFFDGKINNARVWSDIRSSGEVSVNWKKVLTSEDNLQGSWYANNSHSDLTSNNNDLTAVATPTFSTDLPFTATEALKDSISAGSGIIPHPR